MTNNPPQLTWQLHRTAAAEAAAQEFIQSLQRLDRAPSQKSLYGILLVQTAAGDVIALKGCPDGCLDTIASQYLDQYQNQYQASDWALPLPVQAQMCLLEIQTLTKLTQLKQALISLQELPHRQEHQRLSDECIWQRQQLSSKHRKRKQQRDRQRTYAQKHLQGAVRIAYLAALEAESQKDSLERRRLKEKQAQRLRPSIQKITRADQQIQTLKQQYKTISQAWQKQMQTAYRSEISGINRAIAQKECSFNQAIGKDICDLYSRHCAATKLLYHAAIHRLTPLSLAEFWWGASAKDDYLTNPFHKISPNDCRHLTAFYQTARAGQIPAPLVQPTAPLPIIYQDQHLIVINKPGGLLSVPGRRYALQDSVLSRLHYQLPAQPFLQAVHRLDQATSGLLVVATSAHVHSTLSQQFAQRQINKTYEAILSRPITKLQNQDCGTLALPIWSNPEDRPKQTVNFKQGKPSRTDFKILTSGQQPRVKFTPHTGRTHQLRVHAAHPKGLDSPILGDTLYGKATNKESFSQVRLHLHATSLEFAHPVSQKPLSFHSKAPF